MIRQNSRMLELLAVLFLCAEYANAEDADFDHSDKCAVARNVCRDGVSLCPQFRQEFIEAGQICHGVTDTAPYVNAPAYRPIPNVTPPSPQPTPQEQYRDAEAEHNREVQVCRQAMSVRPIINMDYLSYGGQIGARRYMMSLCQLDPQAALKPLPWEKAREETSGAPQQDQPEPPHRPGFLIDEHTSGFNKVCIYNQKGSEAVITIPVAHLCPLQLPQ